MFSNRISAQDARATFSRSRLLALLAAMILSMGLVACADDDDTPQDNNTAVENNDPVENNTPAGIEIAGVYESNFGGTETISDTAWVTESEGFAAINTKVDSFDNDANVAITQNAEDAEYSPNAFNKVVWTEPDAAGAFYYCTVAFGLATAEEAAADETVADDSDPANAGCAGFSWTQLSPKA
ncbi:hypothetical protein [Bradymonas sediminis]|uniref:Uncharacterized protein n=1 Tax=Bradymonas sediminis TaxID=1548548 RepID=A0A2Z4FNY1_9DELT|nr:hypothetical protein [Bradymonas sediminis]AWV90689.1 hypothetical protein DN745_15750 [Bradymonas sediminis]TDP62671.1 hypothetical protein DFR33_11276 [Bradymonas sediminis]